MTRTASSLSIPLFQRPAGSRTAEERAECAPGWSPVDPALAHPGLAALPPAVARGLGLEGARRRHGTRLLRLSSAQIEGACLIARDGSAAPIPVRDVLLVHHPLGHSTLLIAVEGALTESVCAEATWQMPGLPTGEGAPRSPTEVAAALLAGMDVAPAGSVAVHPEPEGGLLEALPQALANGERRVLEGLTLGLVDGLDALLDAASAEQQTAARTTLRSAVADATRALLAHDPVLDAGPSVLLDRARVAAGVPVLRAGLRSRLGDARAVLNEADRAAEELATRRSAEALRRAREDEERRWKHEQAMLRERDLAREARWREERAQADASDREKRGFEAMIVRIGAFAVPFTVLGGLFGMNVTLPPLGFWAVIALSAVISLIILFLPPLKGDRRPDAPAAPPAAPEPRSRKRAAPPS
jgi:hypothetical protein